MHVAYAFCPAFIAAARRRWLFSCQLLRPEPRLIDRSRRKPCIPYTCIISHDSEKSFGYFKTQIRLLLTIMRVYKLYLLTSTN